MGLDFSHGEAHWSYGGFSHFRHRLAKEINIELDEMDGFYGVLSWEAIDDPIKILLNHSDCDGILTPEECAKVEPRIRELIADWPDGDYDKRHAVFLCEGMKRCIELNENLRFR